MTDAFNNLEPEEKDVIQGYVDGVNEHLLEVEADPSSLLPFEFVALGLTPEPWTTNQLLAWMVVLLRQADPEAFMLTQIENAAMITRLTRVYGEETAWAMFNDLRWTQDPAAMAIIDYGSGRNLRSERSLEDNIHLGTTRRKETNNFETCANKMIKQRMKALNALKQKNAIVKLGSYGWVVSGDHTESGYPTLYAGSQLGFEAPSIAGEGSIQAGGLNVSGEIIPAVPMIIDTVRTPHNTWGFQVASAHTTDYYLEDSNEVSLHRIETVLVAGQDDVELPVYRGRGPVVSAFGDKFITWKYSHWNYEFQSVGAFLKMLRATSIDEFEVGVNELGLSDHVLYADKEGEKYAPRLPFFIEVMRFSPKLPNPICVLSFLFLIQGNIAHWMAGRDPVRSSGEWRLPQGFLDDPIEWDAGVIKPIPTDRNTPRGWYGDWNNKPRVDYLTGLNSVYQIQGPFHGAHAIYDYLDEELVSKGRLTFKQIRDLTLNIAVTESLGVRFGAGGTPWVFVGKYFHDAVNRIGKTDARASALELLDSWDGKFVSGGKDFWINGTERAEGWVLSANWISEVLRMVFFDELAIPSEDGSLQLPGPERLMFNALLHGLEYPLSLTNRYDWFTNLNDSSAPQDADSIIVAALDKVLANWNTYDFSRGYITYGHDLLGEVWRAPLLNRATYDHLVEMGPGGPVRIERYVAVDPNPDSPSRLLTQCSTVKTHAASLLWASRVTLE